MPDACYALLAATLSRNKPQTVEALAIDGSLQALNEPYVASLSKPNPLNISPLERPFVLKILSRTQRATDVKKVVEFSLKPLHSKVMALFAYLQHPTAILQRYSAQLFDGRAF